MMGSTADIDLSIHIQRCMTKEEFKTFLDNFCRNNPHYRGAEVADVLTTLYDTDSHLEVTDAMYEAHRQEIAPYSLGLYSMTCYVAIYLRQGTEWPTIHSLMERFNPKKGDR
jgi:hypothetical protein